MCFSDICFVSCDIWKTILMEAEKQQCLIVYYYVVIQHVLYISGHVRQCSSFIFYLSPVTRRCTGRHSKQSGSSLLPLSPCKWSQSDPRDEYPGNKRSGGKPFRIVLKVTHKHKQKIMWNKGSTSHLWAKGDFSETLLYGNFLSVWTDQKDLRPAHLKQRQTQKVRLCKCLCVCYHQLAEQCTLCVCVMIFGVFVTAIMDLRDLTSCKSQFPKWNFTHFSIFLYLCLTLKMCLIARFFGTLT